MHAQQHDNGDAHDRFCEASMSSYFSYPSLPRQAIMDGTSTNYAVTAVGQPWPCVKLKIGVEQNSSKCGSDGIELHAPEAYHEHGMCTLSMDNLRQDTGKAAACTTYKNMAFLNPTLLVPISHSGAQP
eukprot:scaffold14299_cov20-Tisochrysis_lutea.AAC.1